MARKIRIGSICKRKDGKGLYMKIGSKEPVTLKPGQYVNVDTQKQQREDLERRVAEGKVSGDWVQKELARIETIPEFVMAECSVTIED